MNCSMRVSRDASASKKAASQPESLQALKPQCHHDRGVAVPKKDQDSCNFATFRGHQSFPHKKHAQLNNRLAMILITIAC